jgi:hypothetical protein
MSVIGLLLATPAMGQSAQPALADIGNAKSVKLAKIIVSLERGEQFGVAKYAGFCLFPEKLIWRAQGKVEPDLDRFDGIFARD